MHCHWFSMLESGIVVVGLNALLCKVENCEYIDMVNLNALPLLCSVEKGPQNHLLTLLNSSVLGKWLYFSSVLTLLLLQREQV